MKEAERRERGDKTDDSIAPEKDCGEADDPDWDDPTSRILLYICTYRGIYGRHIINSIAVVYSILQLDLLSVI